MSHLICANYEQVFLFPPTLEDLVPANHPARFIREFVAQLDLGKLGIRVPALWTGAPAYDPRLLLSVWLYGHFCRIRSTRKLERACFDNIGMMWLAGMHKPDHNTLWAFWRDNKKALKQVFKESVSIAYACGLVGMLLHALDGTKVAAECSRHTGWHRKSLDEAMKRVDALIEELVAKLSQGVEGEDGSLPAELTDAQARRERIQQRLAGLDAAGEDHLHPGEEEARMMKLNEGGTKFAYNAQTLVDQQSRMIVSENVVTAEADNHEMVPMLDQTKEDLGAVAANNVADGGYLSGETVVEAEEKKYTVAINMGLDDDGQGVDRGVYPSTQFTYDAEKDTVTCPHGKELGYQREKQKWHKNYKVRVFRCRQFKECPFREQCSHDKQGRTIEIAPHYEAMRRQREKQQRAEIKEILKARGGIVERIYAVIKEHDGFRRFTVRGLENVRAQWSLICTTVNLRRLYEYWLAGELTLGKAAQKAV